MKELPPGERLVRCLIGESVDRIPFGVNLGWMPWPETLNRWRQETANPSLDPAQEFSYDLSFARPAIHAGIFPPYPHQVLRDEGDLIVWRDERGITMRNRKDGSSMPEFLDYPVKTPDDWEKLKVERLNPETPGRITEDWDAFRARLRATGEAVQVGWYPYGVFGMPRDLMGVEALLIGFYETPDMIYDMMQHLTTLWLRLWEQVAVEVRIDHIHIWEDMSGRQGSLISPAMVEKFMMPCYDRIADFARSIGARLISVDTDGDCKELVEVMTRHGVNMFFPFEVQAGNDILDYRQRYPTLGIQCGLDKRALASSLEDIDREVERADAMLRMGRYVPGFDHMIPPDVPWERFAYAARRIKALCYTAGRG